MSDRKALSSLAKETNIEYRLFKITLWITTAVFAIWCIVAVIADYTIIIKLTYGLCFLIYSGLLVAFYRGVPLMILAAIFYTLIFIIEAYTWVPAGGITGVMLIMSMMVFISGLLVLPLRAYLIFICLSLILVVGYFTAELINNDLAVPYGTNYDRIRDFGIAGIIAIVSIGFALFIFKREYLKDRVHLRETINELEAEKEKALAADKAKSEFLAVISHEMRTPLNGVVGLTELLSETSLDEEQQEMLQNLSFSSGILNSLISDILDLTLIESGKLIIQKVDFSIESEIRKSLELIQPRLQKKEKKITLGFSHDSDIPEVISGDVARFRQILINLLSNAVKFTEEGQILLSTELKSKTEHHIVVRTEVKDSGHGIPRQRQNQLFTKFYKAASNPNIEGTGLGLSISKQLVELMNGTIGFESEEGEGSTFFFELPFEAGKAEQSQDKVQEELSLKGLRVLIAEDVRVNQMVIKKMVAAFGPDEVSLAENGAVAVQAALERRFDLILMDIQMPVMDGVEAAKKICEYYKNDANPPLIISVSANAMKEDLDAYRDAGMKEFLSKPISKSTLASILRKYV